MNARWKNAIVGALVAGGVLTPRLSRAEDALQDRLDRLEQRTAILERKSENDQDAAADKAKTAQTVTAAPGDGFTLKNADKSFVLKLQGYVQSDLRTYINDKASALANQFLIRRARFWLEGTLYNTVDFRIVPDFGGTATALQDAYVNLRYWTPFQLKAGKFKVPFGLERLQPSNNTLFVETSYATALTPNYDIGVQIGGDLWNGAASYAVGWFNGVPDNQNASTATGDNADGKDVAARVFLLPFKNSGSLPWKDLGVGFAATHGRALNNTAAATALPGSFTTPGQQAFFAFTPSTGTDVADGNRTRWSPQLYWFPGRLGLLAEYVAVKEKVRHITNAPLVRRSLDLRAWNVQASYTLTGETATYSKGLKPLKNFDPANHTWGAWELATRYTEFRADQAFFQNGGTAGSANGLFANRTSQAQRARTWTGGLNWYLNSAVKIQNEYDYTWFTGGAPGANASKLAVRELLTRFQVTF
jgi:phosphate-selective porin OprO/OprP